MSEFREIRRRFKRAIRDLLAEDDSPAFVCAAFPAYAHRNPLIDFFFWERLRIAYEFCRGRAAGRILDFGCGPGILVYALARKGCRLTALDLDLAPMNALRGRITFPGNIRYLEGDLLDCALEQASFDAILALDVLEHIDDLEPYLERFAALLAPGGSILVSAPTENWFYRVGRRLAGRRFTGDYHASAAADVRLALESRFVVERVATIVRPVPLFEIVSARRRAPGG